jgi:hypothetical protein
VYRPLPAGSEAAMMAAIRVVSRASRLLLERSVYVFKEVIFGLIRFLHPQAFSTFKESMKDER